MCGRFKQRMDGATASGVIEALEAKDREIERLRGDVRWLFKRYTATRGVPISRDFYEEDRYDEIKKSVAGEAAPA